MYSNIRVTISGCGNNSDEAGNQRGMVVKEVGMGAGRGGRGGSPALGSNREQQQHEFSSIGQPKPVKARACTV